MIASSSVELVKVYHGKQGFIFLHAVFRAEPQLTESLEEACCLNVAEIWIIEYMLSCVLQPWIFIGTKESFYIKKEFNSYRVSLVQQHGHRFIVLKRQYGCHDVTCIHCLNQTLFLFFKPEYSITQQKAKTRHLKQRTGHFTQDIDTGDLSKNILILVFSNQNMGTR